MAYQGNSPSQVPESVPQILDTQTFNGSQTSFTLMSGGSVISVTNVAQLEISIGGVIQAPLTAYTVSGSTITYTSAPPAGASFFGKVFGRVYDVGTVGDYAIITQKIAPNAVTSDKIAAGAAVANIGFTPQQLLVSGTNIKTLGGQSILGSGDMVVGVPMGQVFFMKN